jgi:hypothetical protein
MPWISNYTVQKSSLKVEFDVDIVDQKKHIYWPPAHTNSLHSVFSQCIKLQLIKSIIILIYLFCCIAFM